MTNKLRDKHNIAGIIALSLTVAACGGSSGGGSNGPTMVAPPAQQNPPIAYDTDEYRQNPSLAQMNVQAAYLNGITGNGVLVAVIDSGVSDVPELVGQLHANSTNIATGNAADKADFNGHGTAMAGIIAAKKDHANNNNAFNMHGVAFGAQILNINTTTADDCTSFDDCSFFHSDIALAYDYATAQNVDVINESLGSDTQSGLALQQAVQRAVNAGIVVVVPAGNIDDDTPAGVSDSIQASATFAYAPWANGQIIVAGSVDSNNVISDFSYRAGELAKDVFIVAPGSEIIAPDHDLNNGFEYIEILGTSASTAQISGIVALLIETFPNLTAAQTADLLFTTATDLGAPGTDVIYGRGLVNVAQVFSAQGQLSVAGSGFGAAVDVGTTQNINQQNLVFSGGAFGADISFSAAMQNIMVVDKYDRSFNVDLSKGIYIPRSSANLENFMTNSLSSHYQDISIDDKMTVKLGWQHDNRFSEIDKRYFSNHLGRERRADNLRMSLSYQISDRQIARISSGMSIAEMTEDYRPDDYIARGKHGFSSLLSSQSSQAISYKTPIGKENSLETIFASGKYDLAEDLFINKITVKNTVFINRFTHRKNENLSMSLDLGLLKEQGSVLGAISRGALEIGSGARTAFIGAKMDYFLSDNTQLFARASYGVTTVNQSSQSILGNLSTLKSYSYLVGFKSNGLIVNNDQLSFSFSQPLRLSSGFATISNAISRNYNTNQFIMSYDRVSLRPGGAERDFEMSYSLANIYGANIRFNLLYQLNPGHVKLIKSATSALIRLGSAF